MLLLGAPCAAQSDPPADPFAELLSTLPPIAEASTEARFIEIREGERTVGWGRMDLQARPDASGGTYLLRQHFVFQIVPNAETIAATTEAEVDARFRPKQARIDQAVQQGEKTARVSDALQTGSNAFTLSHMDEGESPSVRTALLPERPFVVGVEYLLPRLPREKLNGATIVELDPQAGAVAERRVKVIGLPQGRASIVVKDVQGEREATYTVAADGSLEWIQQGTLVFRVCAQERWEKLRKQFPDVE